MTDAPETRPSPRDHPTEPPPHLATPARLPTWVTSATPAPLADHAAAVHHLDAHVHLWDTSRRVLPWLPAGHPLRRDFTLPDLARAAGGRLPDTILVQADTDPLEVTDLLGLAAATPAVLGVVGWFDLHRSTSFPEHTKLVGVRCPPADQTDPEALDDAGFVRGVRAAADAGLAVDLLLRPPALLGAARLAGAVPGARLVLDHLGNPTAPTDDWLTGMKALADHPNVTVKLSGTAHLPSDSLAGLVDVALDLFGSERLMFGSDWPVCTISGTRAEVLRRTAELLPAAAHNDVFRGTAERTYRP